MTTVEKKLTQHRNWLAQSDVVVDYAFGSLRKGLALGDANQMYRIAVSLGMLATYNGIKGAVAISDGNSTGWDDLSKAINYRYWAVKIQFNSFSKRYFLRPVIGIPDLTLEMGNVGCLLAFFIALDRENMAASIADMLLQMMSVKGAVDSRYLVKRKFEPFMVWLYSVYEGKNISPELDFSNLGVYQKVIDSWDNPDSLSLTIKGLCENHLACADDVGGNRDPEFKNPPFDLLPLEIHAIYVIRQKLGLVTPSVDHPLLSSPTSAVNNLSIVRDDLSLEVESLFNDLRESKGSE